MEFSCIFRIWEAVTLFELLTVTWVKADVETTEGNEICVVGVVEGDGVAAERFVELLVTDDTCLEKKYAS